MWLRHRCFLFVAAAVSALTIVGCGGGDEDAADTSAGDLTKMELIAQGDAICAEVNAAVGQLGVEAAEAEVADTIPRSADLFTEMIERLRDLGTPKDDDGSYAEFLRAAEGFAKIEVDVKAAAESEDSVALSEVAFEASRALQEFRSQASRYGFEACSEDAGGGT